MYIGPLRGNLKSADELLVTGRIYGESGLTGKLSCVGGLSGQLSCVGGLQGKLSCIGSFSGNLIPPGMMDLKVYNGQYIVVPQAFEQEVLETENKIMTKNVVVTEVPYYEVSNVAGTTAYIAKEID